MRAPRRIDFAHQRVPCAVLGLFLLAAAVPRLFAAQNPFMRGVIAGVVVDIQSGQPIAAAQVSVSGTGAGMATGNDGRFRIADVLPVWC